MQLLVVGLNAFSKKGELVDVGFDEVTAELLALEQMLSVESRAIRQQFDKLLVRVRTEQSNPKNKAYVKHVEEEYQKHEQDKQRAKLAELQRQKDVINTQEPQEVVCSICGDGDVEAKNDILFCDLCDTAVHQVCYGTDEVPPDHWFCDPCASVGFEARGARCIICNVEGGALKRTTNKKWAHVVCGLCIPELYFEDPFRLNAIAGFEGIPLARKKLQCGICKDLGITAKAEFNSCIQCSFKSCCKAFHPFCARLKGYQMQHGSSGAMEAYCFSHRTQLPKYKNFVLKSLDAKPNTEIALCTACLSMGTSDCDRDWFLLNCGQCGVKVHASCLQMSLESARELVKAGPWYCARCTLRTQAPGSPQLGSKCTICLQFSGGNIIQKCADGAWEHMLCRFWTFGPPGKEVSADLVITDRCVLCHQRGGSCIPCASGKCAKTFHALCAAEKGYKMVKSGPVPQIFCPLHADPPSAATATAVSATSETATPEAVVVPMQRAGKGLPASLPPNATAKTKLASIAKAKLAAARTEPRRRGEAEGPRRRKKQPKKRKTEEGDQQEDDNQLYCYCRQRYDTSRAMIQCDHCMDWIHFKCANLHGEAKAQAKVGETWFCKRGPCVLASKANAGTLH